CRCTTAFRSIFSRSGVWQEAKIKRAALSPVIKFPLIYIYLYLAIYFSFFKSVAAIRPTTTSLVSATSCNDFNFLEPSSGRSRIVAAPPSTARVVYPLISLYFSFLPPRYNSPVLAQRGKGYLHPEFRTQSYRRDNLVQLATNLLGFLKLKQPPSRLRRPLLHAR